MISITASVSAVFTSIKQYSVDKLSSLLLGINYFLGCFTCNYIYYLVMMKKITSEVHTKYTNEMYILLLIHRHSSWDSWRQLRMWFHHLKASYSVKFFLQTGWIFQWIFPCGLNNMAVFSFMSFSLFAALSHKYLLLCLNLTNYFVAVKCA